MNSIIAELQEIVKIVADANNDKAILNAVINSQLSCEACSYPQNAKEFNRILGEYVKLRKLITKRSRYLEVIGVDLEGEITYDRLIVLQGKAKHLVKVLQRELKQYWPCKTCIERFNPTHKPAFPNRKHKVLNPDTQELLARWLNNK